MNFIKFMLLIFCILLMGCVPETKNLGPRGDRAEIKTKGNKLYTGELLFVTEEAIFMQLETNEEKGKTGIYKFPNNTIQYIAIKDYINTKWKSAILYYEVVPIGLLIVSAATADADSPASVAVLLLPALINYAIFAASTPSAPGVEDPFSAKQVNELRKYARFPQALDEIQFKSYLSMHNQDDVKLVD